MEIKKLEGIEKKEILSVFNESFSDYFIPFKLTEKQLESKLITDKIDLKLSVGAFENKKLIAFILHGFDIVGNQNLLYNGGTGVIPKKRGLGLTKKMYSFIFPILKKEGINKIVLEVIDKNIQAIKSYEKSGFITKRKLACYKGEYNYSKVNTEIVIKELSNYHWEVMESFWEVNPSWQNSKKVLEELRLSNISLGAYIKNELVGYVIYNPNNKRIQQIATNKNFRKERIASTLIFELSKKYGNTFSAINIDMTSKSTNDFFYSIGFENYLEQLEMELKIYKTKSL